MSDRFAFFKKEAIEFCSRSPSFSYIEVNGVPEFSGELPLADVTGEIVDTYNIKVVGVEDYPLWFPHVFETGGRVPVNIDWHVHADGHCCICSIPEELIICNAGLSLQKFMDEHVKPYFFNQKYRELNGFFLNERSHGNMGNLEYFFDAFKTRNLFLIVRCLTYIRDFSEPGRVQNCFCGSGIKYRKCHREAYRSFKMLPINILDWFIDFIKSSM